MPRISNTTRADLPPRMRWSVGDPRAALAGAIEARDARAAVR